MKKIVLFIVSLLTIFGTLLAEDLFINEVKNISENLITYQSTVTATNYGKRTITVKYIFKFKRENNKMYIEYLEPKNMKGAKIAIDGKYFYNYIPNLHRLMKKKLGKSTKNPGEEMGFLFHFVLGDLNDFLKKYGVKRIDEDKKIVKFELYSKKEREIVIFDKETKLPIQIKIYSGKKLKIKMELEDSKIDENIPDEIFVIKG